MDQEVTWTDATGLATLVAPHYDGDWNHHVLLCLLEKYWEVNGPSRLPCKWLRESTDEDVVWVAGVMGRELPQAYKDLLHLSAQFVVVVRHHWMWLSHTARDKLSEWIAGGVNPARLTWLFQVVFVEETGKAGRIGVFEEDEAGKRKRPAAYARRRRARWRA